VARNILITGGAGFIGSRLSDALVSRGENVVVLDNFNDYYDPKRKWQNLESLKGNANFQLYEGDIRDREHIRELIKNHQFEVVVHLAAMAGVRSSIENPLLYSEVNVIGTNLLLEEMRRAEIGKLVFASSSSVYGNRSEGAFSENDNTDKQISPYGATKKSVELLAHTYHHLFGMSCVGLRFFTVYGPRNRPDMACYKFVEAIEKGLPLTRYGNGGSGRDYTYIDDIVEGIIKAIETPLGYEIINLGNSSPIRLTEMIETVEKVCGKEAKIKQLPMQPGDVEWTYADITKAKQLMDWEPKTSFSEGMEKLVDWYRNQRDDER